MASSSPTATAFPPLTTTGLERSNSLSSTTSSLSVNSPVSPVSSSPSRKNKAGLTLDLSSLPPLQPPATPTNTLLFTNLTHPDIFRPDNLQTIRDLVEKTAPLHSWAPLKSFRRVVASFHSTDDAARVRAAWQGEPILGQPCQVYFGRPTPLNLGGKDGKGDQHLALPDAGKLFFISPPPSPPHGWEMHLEGAPNKQVHAEDLAEALAKLHHQAPEDIPSPVSATPATTSSSFAPRPNRSRSSTLILYQPADHGDHSDLPAIAVEDLTAEPEEDYDDDNMMLDDSSSASASPSSATVAYDGMRVLGTAPIMAHTARPPVELMHSA